MADVFDDLARAFKAGYDCGHNENLRDVKSREELIMDLCTALERAQEIIVMLGEKSGNEELLNEAKVYANAVGDLAHDIGPKPFPDYSDDPFIKYHWSNKNRDGSLKGEKP